MPDIETDEQAATPAKKPVKGPTSEVLLEVDLGDDELVVRQFSDGMFTLAIGAGQLLMNQEQMREVVRKLAIEVGGAKGWVLNEDFGL